MLDRFGEQLTSLVEIVAGIEQPLDLRAVLGPLFELVEITIVRAQRVISVSSSDPMRHAYSLSPFSRLVEFTDAPSPDGCSYVFFDEVDCAKKDPKAHNEFENGDKLIHASSLILLAPP